MNIAILNMRNTCANLLLTIKAIYIHVALVRCVSLYMHGYSIPLLLLSEGMPYITEHVQGGGGGGGAFFKLIIFIAWLGMHV